MFEDVSGAPADGPAADLVNGGKPVQLAQAPAEPIGSVEELTGTVTLTRADGSTSTAAPGDPVFLNDTVATASDSSVEIAFVDGTRFSLGQDGQMTLDQLVYDPGGGDNELDLSVVQGAFTFVTGAIAGAPGEGMEVNLPVGTIGIRGTAVGGGPDGTTPDPTDYTVVLLPEEGGRFGRIVLTDVNGRSVILDQPLEAMDISSLGLAPGEPVVLTREQVLDLLGLAVENLEDILEEVQNFESLEDQQTPEAGPQQRGDILPGTPNTGGVNTPRGETRSLDELTTLFSLSDQQGLGGDDQGGPLGGFTPGGGLGNEENDLPAGRSDPDGPTGSDPVTTPPPGSGLFVLTGGEGDDLLDASDIGAANIIGLGGNDTLVGSSQDDILQGGDGDDTLDAGAGNDQVFGGGGNDTIIGGSGEGNDHYDGGAGIDTVKYSSATQSITVNLETGVASGDPAIGSDTLVDVENVIGGGGGDFITGDGAANRLEGGAGNDELTGGGGNDTIIGGDGDDVAVFSGNRDDYQITGGEGGFYVTDLRDGANDGTDFVAYDVEALRFADQEVAVAPKAFDDVHVVSESQQEVTNGAAMRTTVTASAGSVLTLKVNFLDSEPDGAEETFKDFAVIVIDGKVFKLADVDASETPLGTAFMQFDEQTGYFTFTFEFATSGEHQIGIAVLNEGDERYDAGLLIDDLSITGGSSGEGFENGLGGWEPIGSVSVEGEVAGIPAPEGSQQALLVSKGVSSAAVEQFLGLAPGQLSTLGNQPVISGNVLGNDATGAADVAVASVIYSGEPGDVQDVNGTTANGITTFMASDGSWKLEFNLTTGDYVFTVLETLSHPGSDALSFPFTYSIKGVTGIVSNATLTILVNDGVPSAVDDVATATEGGEATGGNLLFNDGFSPDGAWITSIVVGGEIHSMPGSEPITVETPLGGWLVVHANGEWSYEPPAVVEGNSPVTESFTYTVTDGDGDTSSATVDITVEPSTNQAPTAVDDDTGYMVKPDDFISISIAELLANDSDPDGDALTLTDVHSANGGSVSLDGYGNVVFYADEGASGPASFSYTISDGKGGTATGTVNLTVGSPNGDPVAADDFDFTTAGGEALYLISSDLLANDSDPDSDPLSLESVGNAQGGTVEIDVDNNIVFTPTAGYTGPASFTYTISDGNGGTATATVHVTVEDRPSLPTDTDGDDNYVLEGAETNTPVGLAVFSEAPSGGEVTYSLADDAGGRFKIDPTTGEVRVADGALLDHETDQSHTILVVAEGPTGLVSSREFVIQVGNVAEAPSIPVDDDGTLNSISRYAPVGATVGIVASSVDPEGTEVTYTLEDPSGIFAIDQTTGVVSVANRDLLQGTASQSLAITIIASDAGGLTSSETFFIDVTNDGTPGDDVITGTEQADEISALAGNDTILGLAGDDILKGDEGTDMLVGGAGNDELDGGDGMDYAVYTDATSGVTVDLREGIASDGQGGSDTLISIEHVYGSGYSDLIHGDQGANFLFGGAGNDELYGHGGDDFLNGGDGDDEIDGGEGHDTVSYAENGQGVTVDLAEGWASQGYDIGDDILFNIESVIGTEYSDWIAGDDNDNTIIGNGGADVLEGRGGDDVLVFESQEQLDGIEQLDGGEGRDTLRIVGEGESIDLSQLHSMESIERIDTSGNGANEIALNAADVIYLSDDFEIDPDSGAQITRLTILGDAADTVTFHDTGWEKQAGGPVPMDGTSFHVYFNEGVKVYVEADIGGQPIA